MSNIETILVASTNNIKEETATWLNQQAYETNPEMIVYLKDTFGWFIPLPTYPDSLESWDTIPSDLSRLAAYAIGKGCCWLMIDHDASDIKDLPTYGW